MKTKDLLAAITYLCPTAVLSTNYGISADPDDNATIAHWHSSLGTQPTTDQLTAASAAVTLNAARKAKMSSLMASYNAARYGTPVTVTLASGASVSVPTSQTTQMDLMGYRCTYDATDWPSAGVPLQVGDGTVHMVTYADVKAIAVAIAVASQPAWQKLNTLSAQVSAATTLDAVNAVVW